MKTLPTTTFLADHVRCDQVTKRGDLYTFRRGFFYTYGMTSDGFEARVLEDLAKLGLRARTVESGEIWKAFRGGASLANQSHWWVKAQLEVRA